MYFQYLILTTTANLTITISSISKWLLPTSFCVREQDTKGFNILLPFLFVSFCFNFFFSLFSFSFFFSSLLLLLVFYLFSFSLFPLPIKILIGTSFSDTACTEPYSNQLLLSLPSQLFISYFVCAQFNECFHLIQCDTLFKSISTLQW